jgi:uncharacterized Zn finger protein (UPF0148 family)
MDSLTQECCARCKCPNGSFCVVEKGKLLCSVCFRLYEEEKDKLHSVQMAAATEATLKWRQSNPEWFEILGV